MTRDRQIRTAVLMGGISSEREVSLHSGGGVAAALRSAGFEVFEEHALGEGLFQVLFGHHIIPLRFSPMVESTWSRPTT